MPTPIFIALFASILSSVSIVLLGRKAQNKEENKKEVNSLQKELRVRVWKRSFFQN